MADDSGPIEWLKRLGESSTRIRLAPGVIGKSSTMWIGLIVAWVVVLARLSATEFILDGALFAGGVFLSLLVLRETGHMRAFAEKNPELALLEGADIIEYKRFEAQSKSLSSGDPSNAVGGSLGPTSELAQDRAGA